MKPSGEALKVVQKSDIDNLRDSRILKCLDLEHVVETFAGNADIRGVSGEERRRVSVGEMMQSFSPVLSGHEVSSGLDA